VAGKIGIISSARWIEETGEASYTEHKLCAPCMSAVLTYLQKRREVCLNHLETVTRTV
jgi:hypothetical protein